MCNSLTKTFYVYRKVHYIIMLTLLTKFSIYIFTIHYRIKYNLYELNKSMLMVCRKKKQCCIYNVFVHLHN